MRASGTRCSRVLPCVPRAPGSPRDVRLLTGVGQPMPTRAIVFDLDGLPVDSKPLWLAAETAFLATHGCGYDPEIAKRYAGLRLRDVIGIMQREYGISGDPRLLGRDLLARLLDHCDAGLHPCPVPTQPFACWEPASRSPLPRVLPLRSSASSHGNSAGIVPWRRFAPARRLLGENQLQTSFCWRPLGSGCRQTRAAPSRIVWPGSVPPRAQGCDASRCRRQHSVPWKSSLSWRISRSGHWPISGQK